MCEGEFGTFIKNFISRRCLSEFEPANKTPTFNSSISVEPESLLGQPAQGASPARPWQDVDPKTLPGFRLRARLGPRSYRSLKLYVGALRATLQRAPLEGGSTQETIIVDLPLPDVGFMRFSIKDSPIIERQLANRYPEIKTYRGQGIDEPTAITRFDWTQYGFHGIILSTRGTILIEPDSLGDISNYVVYFDQDQSPGSFQCEVDTATQEAALKEHEHQNLSGHSIKRFLRDVPEDVPSGSRSNR